MKTHILTDATILPTLTVKTPLYLDLRRYIIIIIIIIIKKQVCR